MIDESVKLDLFAHNRTLKTATKLISLDNNSQMVVHFIDSHEGAMKIENY